MCTVSFIPQDNRIYLVSNRDEKHFRSTAIPPVAYQREQGQILYPKDGDAGGTWIAIDDFGHAIVFLNGAFEAHQSTPPYRRSRGKILLDVFESASPVESCAHINLDNIEPFTAVIWSDAALHEFRWDGKHKHLRKLNARVPHIWSSVTLYDPETIQKRQAWFNEWINNNPSPSLDDVLRFHRFAGDGDEQNDLLMNRNGHVYTVSITGVCISADIALMKYIDLKHKDQTDREISLRPIHMHKG